MSNHYHIVVKLNPAESDDWSQDEIIDRWRCIYKGPRLIQRYVDGENLTVSESQSVAKFAATYKERLMSLSWFMKALNEPIAKMANKEDDCTGHFWESRFCSQGLSTYAALMACMVYVDMNPYRAGLVKEPLDARYTSLRERTKPSFALRTALRNQYNSHALRDFCVTLKPLVSFSDESACETSEDGITLPFKFEDYCELVNWTSKAQVDSCTSSRAKSDPKILAQIGLTKPEWLIDSQHFETLYRLGAFRRAADFQPNQLTTTEVISY